MTKIGIITALRAEAACLTRSKPDPASPHYLSEQLLLVLSGMGTTRVNEAIDALLAQKVDGLVSFGTAGALTTGIRSGDIIIPEKIINANGKARIVSSFWRDKVIHQLSACPANVHGGDMATTSNIIASTGSKHALHEKTTAIAVDMESALITSLAHDHKLPTLTIRIIVDEIDMNIPDKILENTDAFGQIAIPALLRAIVFQPGLIRELLKLGSAFKAASRSMRWIGNHAEQLLLPG